MPHTGTPRQMDWEGTHPRRHTTHYGETQQATRSRTVHRQDIHEQTRQQNYYNNHHNIYTHANPVPCQYLDGCIKEREPKNCCCSFICLFHCVWQAAADQSRRTTTTTMIRLDLNWTIQIVQHSCSAFRLDLIYKIQTLQNLCCHCAIWDLTLLCISLPGFVYLLLHQYKHALK